MPVIPFRTITLVEGEVRWLGFLSSFQGFRHGELDGRELQPFPLIVRKFHCFFVPLPFDLPSAAATPVAGFASCLSQGEKCFSRFFCSRYRTSMFFSLLLSFDFPFLKSILSVQRQ